MNLKRVILAALVLSSLWSLKDRALAWAWLRDDAAQANAAAPVVTRVQVAMVERRDMVTSGYNTTSTLNALEEVELKPKVTGRLESLSVSTGDRVEVGQTLAVLDHRDQAAQVAALRAQVAVNRAQATEAQVQMDNAQREFERYRRLREEGYATQQEFDTRDTTYQAAKASYAQAQAQVEQAQANLRVQEVVLSEYTLTAPIPGMIMEDYDWAPGALLTTSSDVFRIARIDLVRALIDIPEGMMNRVQIGMEAALSFESIPDRQFAGEVTLINPFVDTSTRTVRIEVTVDNASLGYILKPGMFARVYLVEATEANPLVIPAEALRADGTVLLVEDGRVKVTPVQTSMGSGRLVTIASGLEAGDVVVVSGGRSLVDGDLVAIAE